MLVEMDSGKEMKYTLGRKLIGKMALDISTSKHPSQIPLALELKKRRHGHSIVNGFAKPGRGNLTFKSWS